MPTIEDVLARVDLVIRENRRIEWIYIVLTALLFGTGIACFVSALITREFAWSTPSAITTALLYWPLQEIKDIRAKNIALAAAPVLISQLPKAKAAEELQKLIQSLYGNGNNDRL